MEQTQPQNIEANGRERRKMRRLIFSASAEVRDLSTGQTFHARIADMGIGGCFLDTVFPLGIGIRLYVTFGNPPIQFGAYGTVAYVQERIGMGVKFDELDEQQRFKLMALI